MVRVLPLKHYRPTASAYTACERAKRNGYDSERHTTTNVWRVTCPACIEALNAYFDERLARTQAARKSTGG